MKKKIGIIGAGASGMVCALVAARAGCKVTLIEKNKKVGRKILATGNGRCNITNADITLAHYHGHHPGFVSNALKQFGTNEVTKFFNQIGLELTALEDGRMFPMSLQASSVVDFLEDALIREGTAICTGVEVTSVGKKYNHFTVAAGEEKFIFDKLVVATGSLAMPSLGSSEIGYSLAQSFGHRIYPQFATLVQLISDDPFVKKASGVKIEAVVTSLVEGQPKSEIRGDLLFTDYGLSGLAILDISRDISHGLQQGYAVAIHIDLMPDLSLSALKKKLQQKSRQFDQKPMQLWLNGILHKKLVSLLLEKLQLLHTAKPNMKQIQSLAYLIKNLTIDIIDTRGAKGAEVMAGGIDCSEVDPKTYMSRLKNDLYFTGEVLDIDGDRGGYNLHFAWASGYLAGKHLLF